MIWGKAEKLGQFKYNPIRVVGNVEMIRVNRMPRSDISRIRLHPTTHTEVQQGVSRQSRPLICTNLTKVCEINHVYSKGD